ncbi:MAG: hypothetical protein Q8R02_19040 [Hyphomonadaceae bacterium]|nr:hypothetical protein [Hyphomonadaceae bacterium]
MIGGTDGRDLVDRLRSIARNGKTIDVAQMQFVGLDQVRVAYGDRWRVEHDRIQDVAHSFITKRIHNEDILIPCDNGFVIVFGAVDSAEASFTAHSIGQSLNQFFLGDEATKHFKVDTVHETVPVQGFSEFMNGLSGTDPSKARRGEIQPGPAADAVDFGLRFQPVWDVKHEAVTTYYAEAINLKSGERIAGYQFEDSIFVTARLLEIDEVTLRASEVAMRSMFEAGKKAILGVSIHVSSLVKMENRSRILHIISQFDPELCKYRAIKLSGVVPGFPRLYLKDTVAFLSAHIPHVVLSMNAAEDDFSTALDCEAWGLGYTLPPGSRLAEDPNFFAKVRQDAAAARSHSKRFFVEGSLTPRQAHQCAQCGIDFLASSLVWPAAKSPSGVFKWSASRFLVEAGGA